MQQSWDRTHRQQLLLVRLGTVLLASLVIAGLTIILGPVRGGLERRDQAEFVSRADLVNTELRAGIREALSLAADFASRPVLTQHYRALIAGQQSLAEYREFADPRLQFTIGQNPQLKAYARVTEDGTLATRIGFQQVPPLADLAEPTILPDLLVLDGEQCIVATAPVRVAEDGAPSGWDLLAYSLEPIAARGLAAVRAVPGTCFTVGSLASAIHWTCGGTGTPEAAAVSELDRLLAQSLQMQAGAAPGVLAVAISGEPYLAVLSNLDFGLGTVIAAPAMSIHGHTRAQVVWLAAGAGLASTLVMVGQLTLVQLYGRRVRKESIELAGLVAARTEELTRAVSEKELLIREVHHRIKNDMHLVQSLLALRRKEAGMEGTRSDLQDAEATVAMMGRVYERLYRGRSWGEVDVRPVLESLLKEDLAEMAILLPYSVDSDIADIRVPQQTAVSLGIMVNELATNAIKHGANSRGGVHLRVAVRVGHGGGLELQICDTGPGFPADQLGNLHGSGLGLLAELVSGMGGEFRTWNDGGACVLITLPPGCMVC